MPFDATLEVRALKRALAPVVPSSEKRRGLAVPVLGAVRLEIRDDRLVVEATDLDHWAHAAAPLAVAARADHVGAAVLVDGRRMLAALNQLPAGDTVRLWKEKDRNRLTIKSGAGLLTLAAPFSPDDWPPAPGETPTVAESDNTRETTLTADFAAALKRVKPFMSCEETRYYLNGVFVHEVAPDDASANPSISLVATDGHRLGRVVGLGETGGDGNRPGVFDGCDQVGARGFILPALSVAAYLRLFTAADTVRLAVQLVEDTSRTARLRPVRVIFEAGEGARYRRLTSRLIDGTYPDYRRVIPSEANHAVLVDRRALDSALQLASVMASQGLKGRGTRAGTLSVQPDGDARRLVVDALTDEDDGALLPVPIAEASDAFVPVAFNMDYLRAMLASAEGDEVTIRTVDAGSPAVLTESNFLAVLMPMRGAQEPRPLSILAAQPVEGAA